jgi:hypothetical protein
MEVIGSNQVPTKSTGVARGCSAWRVSGVAKIGYGPGNLVMYPILLVRELHVVGYEHHLLAIWKQLLAIRQDDKAGNHRSGNPAGIPRQFVPFTPTTRALVIFPFRHLHSTQHQQYHS